MEEEIIIKEPNAKINSARDLFRRITKIKGIDFKQENFIVFYLNTQNIIKGYDVLFKGGLNSALIDLRTIFRNALKKNSKSIIVAHNHPSNYLNPSDEDKDIFERIKKAGDIIGISCLDSIIFNKDKFYSIGQE